MPKDDVVERPMPATANVPSVVPLRALIWGRWERTSSDSRYLTAILLVAVLISITAAAFRLHALNGERAVAQFQDRQLHTADMMATALRSELTGASRALKVTSATAARLRDRGVFADVLDAQFACADTPCLASLAAFAGDQSIVHTAGRPLDLADDQVRAATNWARTASAGQVQTIIPASRAPSLVLVTPWLARSAGDHTQFAGIIGAQVDFDALFAGGRPDDAVASQRFSTLVLDGRGDVIFHSTRPEMRMNNVLQQSARCFTCHQSLQHVERMFAMKHGALQYSVRGVPKLAAVAPVEFEGETWVVALMAPVDSAVGVLSAELRELGLVVLGMVLAVGVAAHVTWKDSRRRIHADAEAAHKERLERTNDELTAVNSRLESAAVEWRTTVDTIDAALIVLEPSGRIERMNRAASDTLPGEPFAWLGAPSDRLKDHAPWDSALALAHGTIDSGGVATARVQQPATGRTWDLWCRSPQTRGRHSVVVIARDVTAVVELQASLRRSETMAALGSVVVGVAHEVRNPLFGISSLVDAWSVRSTVDPKPFIDALRREVTRLQALMNELLEYGRPAASTLQLQALAPVVDEAIRSCAAEAAARGVHVAAPLLPADAQAWIDARRFVRVLINVIQNAVQHAPPNTDVVVEIAPAARAESQVAVVVRDRGPGFGAADLPRLFTPFFSRRQGGFGLGLAISERIVAEHHGRIAAANHPDGGAVLTISLPPTAAAGPLSQGVQSC